MIINNLDLPYYKNGEVFFEDKFIRKNSIVKCPQCGLENYMVNTDIYPGNINGLFIKK